MTTDWNSSILIPPLNIKNYSPNGWNAWYTQFKLRTLVTPFNKIPDAEKVAVLLLKLGDEITFIFETFNLEIDKVDYEELVQQFTAYFHPIKSRNVLLTANQKPGESFDQFAKRLTMLSYPCSFGPFRDSLLRDIFLCNMDSMYAKIRDKIVNCYQDPSFPEVLILSKELLLEECNITSIGCSFSATDETTTAHSGPSAYGDDSDVPRNLMQRKERNAEPNTKDPFNFKTPPAQTRENDTDGSSFKLASAIKNALGSNSPKLITSEVPKLDFAFKCFKDLKKSHNGISDTELLSRFSAVSVNNKVRESNGGKSYLREQSLNLSCSGGTRDKSSGVSARLNKFGNKGVTIKPTISSERISDRDSYDAVNSNISSESINGQSSNQNFHDDLDRDGEYCVEKSVVLSRFDQDSSNQNMNAKAKKQEICIKAVDNTKSFSTDQTKSGITTTPKGEPLSNNNADEKDSQTVTTGVEVLNSEQHLKPDPPISKTCFTDVIMVYISEKDDTIYVCPVVKYQYLGTIESELGKLNERDALRPIKNITVGEKYAAPFMGSWFRAEIIAANIKKKTVRISFPDYGNEEDMSLSDLRRLPEEFQELEPLSFPIRLPKGAPGVLRSGSKLRIRPLFMDEDWSWAVELRTDQQE